MRRIILAFSLVFSLAAPGLAGSDKVDGLFDQLAVADESHWQAVEAALSAALAESGSPAMDYLLGRGRAALLAGDFGAATEHLTALVENAPDFAEGWNARATAWFEAGEYGLAVGDIAHVLALEPRHYGAISGLGLIEESTGHPDRALAAYRAALAIHPHHPELREAVQRLERELGGEET